MKEQEVLCFEVGSHGGLNDDINERITLLNDAGKRVIDIIFLKEYGNRVTVCLLCEKE